MGLKFSRNIENMLFNVFPAEYFLVPPQIVHALSDQAAYVLF